MSNPAGLNTCFITGDGRIVNVTDIADIYRDVVNLNTPKSGRIQKLSKDHYSLTCHFDATDCDALESIKSMKAYSLSIANENNDKYIESVRCITDHHSISDIAVATSENGRFLAKLRCAATKVGIDNTGDQILEIWDRSKLVKSINISESNLHGQIIIEKPFHSFRWVQFGDQDKLIYVCRQRPHKYQSFFKQTFPSKNTTDDSNREGKQLNLGHDNNRREDWGECLDGIDHTIVALLDVTANCKITILDIGGYSLADTRWLSLHRTISVVYQEEPRRLGLLHCNNRPTKLVVHDWSESLPKEVFELKNDKLAYYSPRISHSGEQIIFLSSPIYGAHCHASKFHNYNLITGEEAVLVDKKSNVVEHFISELPDNCFSVDDQHLLFTAHDYLHTHMYLYDLQKLTMTTIKFPTTGMTLFDFQHDIILAEGSEINATPTLFVSVLNPVNPGELVAWHQIEDCVHLPEIKYETFKIPTPDNSSFMSAILVTPEFEILQKSFDKNSDIGSFIKKEYDLPTVVVVHGGPHSVVLIKYIANHVVYARLGLRILLINYRGSTGVSEDYLQCLLGKVGHQDVEDCLNVVRHLAKSKIINPEKLVIQGGSHGGFLSCHLSCQDEFKFTSAVIVNPVTELISCHVTSDIPDWVHSCLGKEGFESGWMPSLDDMRMMADCSPFAKLDRANVPTLMLLGNQDRRVKMFQGERWIELLKAKGLKTQCKVYKDRHSLSRVEVMSDRTITSLMWILNNLKSS